MSDPATVLVANCEYWMRIAITLQNCVKPALLDILHDPTLNGLQKNEQQLYTYLLAFKRREQQNLRRVVFPYQWDKLCHVCTTTCTSQCNRQGRTNSEDFDITLIVVLIINCTGLLPPNGDWRTFQPTSTDVSKAACVILARDLRNEINHSTNNSITTTVDFNVYWKRIEHILNGLQYNNMQLFNDLKMSSLDHKMSDKIKAAVDKINTLEYNLSKCQQTQNTSSQDILTVQSKITGLEEDLKNVKNDKQIDTLMKLVNELYASVQDDIQNLQNEQKKMKIVVNSMQEHIESNEKRVQDLEEKFQEKTQGLL